MIGETLGGYRITRKIGEGGMGEVWEAEHVMIGRRAAIKCLLGELSSNNEAIGRFFIEAKAAAMTNHPGLVDIYDQGHITYQGRNLAYIVMEFLDGEDLGTFMRREGKVKPRVTAAIARQVASALGAVHQKGIVHRDLKPDNLFLVKVPGSPGQFRVKVLDFGIAKLTGPENKELSVKTRTGSVLGTPSYMSPEQCRGHGKVDSRSDVYSLGCIMHEMLVGTPPFQGSGYGEVLAQHIYEHPPPLRTIDPSIPDSLEQLILRTLVKNPDQRLQTMDELASVLDNIFNAPSMISMGGSAGTSAGSPTPQGHAAASGAPVPTPFPMGPGAANAITEQRTTTMRGTASQKVPKERGKSRVGVSLAIAAAAAAAIGVAAFVIVGGSGTKGASASASTGTPTTEAAKPEPPKPEPPKPEPAVVAKPEPKPEPEAPKPEPVAVNATPTPTPTTPTPEAPKPEPVAVNATPTPTVPTPEPPKPAPPPEPVKVKVSIKSEPAGAEVFTIDGKTVGKTPFDTELAAGTGSLEYVVRLAGHKEQKIDIPADKGGSQTVKLVANMVKVSLSSEPPGAEVYRADGSKLGKTPLEKELAAGSGTLAFTMKLAGYKEQKVELPADKGGTQTAKLVADKVKVSLSSEPPGAEVFRADGTKLGKTPLEHELTAGTGKLAFTLKLAGHKDAKVELPADKGGAETVKLVAEPAAVSATPPATTPATPKPTGGKKNKPVGDKVINPFAK